MGLFDMFKKKEAAPISPEKPAAIQTDAGPNVLVAPISGRVIKMTDVPDPVFGGEMMGKGCAIWPEGDVAYAPISGVVTVTMGHAVGLASDDGIDVLLHIGVDTVNLEGKGFIGYVAEGDRVCTGDPLIKFDRQVIAAAGYKDCVVFAVSNSDDYSDVQLAVDPESAVKAGQAVVSVKKA